MMNEFTFFRPEAVANAVHRFSEMLEEALTSLGHADLLAPDRADYRLRRVHGADLAVEVELHLCFGAQLTVSAPFACTGEDMRGGVDELRDRLAAVLADLDETLALRAEVERLTRGRMKRLVRSGVRGRVLDVRLSPIDLTDAFFAGVVEVVVECEACHMLRSFIDRWRVRDAHELMQQFERFRDVQLGRLADRDRARAQGAVGFVDPLALALIDRLPEGRQGALRVIARKLEHMWHRYEAEGGEDHIGLTWYDGDVSGVGRLCEGVQLSARNAFIRCTAIDGAAEGRAISDFVQHPSLHGLLIARVEYWRESHAEVRLDTRPVPLTANGQVLDG